MLQLVSMDGKMYQINRLVTMKYDMQLASMNIYEVHLCQSFCKWGVMHLDYVLSLVIVNPLSRFIGLLYVIIVLDMACVVKM